MIITPLKETMKSEAEFGLFYAYAKIGKNKAEELREEGFEVEDSKELNYYPRLHRIFWGNAKVEGDITTLNEKSEEYTFPQKLWIITTKVQNKIYF